MSPPHFHDQNAKTNHESNGLRPTPLKISKDSHVIVKKSPSSSPSSSSSTSCLGMAVPAKPSQQRHPVIIYTHSPKIIHTHPKDFKALVQKLTGLSWSDEERARTHAPQVKQEHDDGWSKKNAKNGGIDDNESLSSVITDENCVSVGDGQVNSGLLPEFVVANPFVINLPVFTPNSTDLLCPNQSFYNYTDFASLSPPSNGPDIGPLEVPLEAMADFDY